MKSFKTFLIERERTPEEGEKLLKYINHRQRKYRTRMATTPYEDQIHLNPKVDYPRDAAHGNILKPKNFKEKSVKKAPIDRLKPTQDFVNIHNVTKLMQAYHKGDDVPPINVLSQKKRKAKREYVLPDGHHRLLAQRLLGRKTAEVNVFRKKVKRYR